MKHDFRKGTYSAPSTSNDAKVTDTISPRGSDSPFRLHASAQDQECELVLRIP